MTLHVDYGDDGPVAAIISEKSFAAFLQSPQGQAACGNTDITARMAPAVAVNITNLTALLRWARERHPDQYPAGDFRSPLSTSAAPYGSKAMKRIWAKFLAWAEGQTPTQ
jgi:hypothetical protein